MGGVWKILNAMYCGVTMLPRAKVSKLLSTAYRKSDIKNRLVPNWMTLAFVLCNFLPSMPLIDIRDKGHWWNRLFRTNEIIRPTSYYQNIRWCRCRPLNCKRQLRHRAVSLRQHGFLVIICCYTAFHCQVAACRLRCDGATDGQSTAMRLVSPSGGGGKLTSKAVIGQGDTCCISPRLLHRIVCFARKQDQERSASICLCDNMGLSRA